MIFDVGNRHVVLLLISRIENRGALYICLCNGLCVICCFVQNPTLKESPSFNLKFFLSIEFSFLRLKIKKSVETCNRKTSEQLKQMHTLLMSGVSKDIETEALI